MQQSRSTELCFSRVHNSHTTMLGGKCNPWLVDRLNHHGKKGKVTGILKAIKSVFKPVNWVNHHQWYEDIQGFITVALSTRVNVEETITAVDNTNGTTLTSGAERHVSLMKSISAVFIYPNTEFSSHEEVPIKPRIQRDWILLMFAQLLIHLILIHRG